ncbi:MAG TPA: GTPase ObgE [Bellilinea sp.]|nr:GTPase ObgE [Bellilinea sp.]
MFIDEATIYIRSGKGGDGFVHFHREKYVNRGGPDGGDGGKGGDVVLQVQPTLNTLNSFRYKTKYIAEDGKKGHINNMTGRSAKDLIVLVPPGTIVYDEEDGSLIGDLTEPYQTLIVGKGGKGGLGNIHFASASHQAPRTATKGEPADERTLRLELKLIADVGLVGLPNAGKSSILAAVTNAKPKIANYPFTTLEPNLGVAELDMDHTLILADIPGLIEGAHQGVGLGDAFLRHIQRTRVLIHVIDGTSEDPIADYTQINNELALFDPQLMSKPMIVVLNKTDVPEVKDQEKKIRKAFKKIGVEITTVSAMTRDGLKDVLWKAYELLQSTPIPEAVKEIPVYRKEDDPADFLISRKDDGSYVVSGKGIERAAKMTFWEFDGSVRRFQKLMERLGVEDELRKMGIENGDIVHIADEAELEWHD